VSEYKELRKGEYVDGSVAYRYSAAPKEAPSVRPQRRPQTKVKTVRAPKKALRMNARYALFLGCAAVFCLVMCVAYLYTQAVITEKSNNISSLTDEISALTVQNDALDYTINGYMDMDYIIKEAKEKLGMVEATQDQVTLYDKSSSEYMKQTGEIPTQK
jgi:cell division protein FtsL